MVQAQDYWKARDLLTQFSDAVEAENALNLSAFLQDIEAQPALDYFAALPQGIQLEGEFAFSECRVDYALMKKGNTPGPNDPKITVQFKEVPKGVWERFWVVDNVFDARGNPLPDQGFPLNSTSGNFTDLSDQVRDITTSDYLGLAPYGKLSRSYLTGRQFKTDMSSTRLTFNNIQLLDSTGAVTDYIYLTMGYRGFPEEWYITDIGPMSQRWLGRDRYVDFLIGLKDSLAQLAQPPTPHASISPVLIAMLDTTWLQQVGDTTYFSTAQGGFDTLYYQVAGEKNALSVGRSSQLFNLRMYPLNHAPSDSAHAPRERGDWSLGLTLGGSRSFATVLRTYSSGDVQAAIGAADYRAQTTFQIGLDLRYHIHPRFSVGLNLSYQPWAYAYNDKQLLSDSSLSNPHWLTTDYAETLQTLGVSLYGTYEFRKAITEGEEPKPVRWIPYAELGAGYGLLLKADALLTQTVAPGVGSLDKDTQEALFTYSTKAYRQMPYVTPSVGLGLRLETKHSDFWLALRFRPMTWNVVRFTDPNDRSLEPLRQGYYRMDDDLGLHQFALTIGYAYVFGKQP